jgi:hypothetical protein
VFSIDQAQQLGALDPSRIIAFQSALRLPIFVAAPELVPRVRSGLQLPFTSFPPLTDAPGQFQLRDDRDELVAIAHVEGGKVIYDRVFIAPRGG